MAQGLAIVSRNGVKYAFKDHVSETQVNYDIEDYERLVENNHAIEGSGNNNISGVYALANAIAGLDTGEDCVFARSANAAKIFDHMQRFIQSDEWIKFCTSNCHRAERAEDTLLLTRRTWLHPQQLAWLLGWYQETIGNPADLSNDVELAVLDMVKVGGVFMPGATNYWSSYIGEGQKTQKAITLDVEEGSHYQPWVPPIDPAEKSHDCLITPPSTYRLCVDPRVGGKVPYGHTCNAEDGPTCSWAMHYSEWEIACQVLGTDVTPEQFAEHLKAKEANAGVVVKANAGVVVKANAGVVVKANADVVVKANADVVEQATVDPLYALFKSLEPVEPVVEESVEQVEAKAETTTEPADLEDHKYPSNMVDVDGVMLSAPKPVFMISSYNNFRELDETAANEADHKLVALCTDRNSWALTSGILKVSAMGDAFIQIGTTLIPRYGNENPRLAPGDTTASRFQLKVSRASIAGALQLDLVLRRAWSVNNHDANKKDTHTSSVCFTFGQVYDHRSKSKKYGIMPGTFKCTWHDEGTSAPYALLEFSTEVAVGVMLDPPADWILSKEDKTFVDILKQFTRANAPKRQLAIRMYPTAKELEDNSKQTTRDALSHLSGERVLPAIRDHKDAFWGYMRSGNTPKIQYNQMLSRYQIVQSGMPFVPHNLIVNFPDNRAAEAVLGYAEMLEFEEARHVANALSLNDHTCTVHAVGQYRLINIYFRPDGKPGRGMSTDTGTERYSVPDGTRVTVDITDASSPTSSSRVTGYSIDNAFDLPWANMLVYVTSQKLDDLDAKLKTAKSANQRYACNVTMETSEGPIMSRIDAVAKAYDPDCADGAGNTFLDMLLYDGDRTGHGTRDPWSTIPGAGNGEKAYAEYKSSHRWTESQVPIVEGTKNMVCGLQLVEGCGGAGKTLLQLAKAHCLAQHGQYVALMSERNGVVDNLCEKFVEKYPDGPRPLRAFPKIPNISDFNDRTATDKPDPTEDGKLSDSDRLMLSSMMSSLRSGGKTSLVKAKYSVEGTIVYHLGKGTKLMDHHFVVKLGVRERDTTSANVDMFDVVRKGLVKLANHPFPSSKVNGQELAIDAQYKDSEWSFEEASQLKQAYTLVKEFVIQNAQVLMTTVYSSGSNDNEVRNNWACQSIRGENKVWLEIDEATTINEAAMLIPLSRTFAHGNFGSAIVSICMYGDTKQLGTVVIGSDGQNMQIGFNEFGAQLRCSLFKRLLLAGFPVYDLLEQSRMPEPLFAPARKLIYKLPIKCTGTFPRDQKFIDMMAKLLSNLVNQQVELKTDTSQAWAWLQMTGNHKRKSTETGSSANFAHFITMMELIEGPLHDFYGERMRDEVFLICPYTRQRSLYFGKFQQLREKYNWSANHLPELYTIDSSASRQSKLVLIDVVCSKGGPGLGFFKESERTCVAFTRARQFCLVLSGTLSNGEGTDTQVRMPEGNETDQYKFEVPEDFAVRVKPKYNKSKVQPLINMYLDYCAKKDCTYQFPHPAYSFVDIPQDLYNEKEQEIWKARVEKKEVIEKAPKRGGVRQVTDSERGVLESELAKDEAGFTTDNPAAAALGGAWDDTTTDNTAAATPAGAWDDTTTDNSAAAALGGAWDSTATDDPAAAALGGDQSESQQW